MLAATPGDAFLAYALATELCNGGDLSAGVQAFEQLREAHPSYLGLYYHLGAALIKLERPAEADAVFADGITRAHAAGDHHALAELRNVRMNAQLEM